MSSGDCRGSTDRGREYLSSKGLGNVVDKSLYRPVYAEKLEDVDETRPWDRDISWRPHGWRTGMGGRQVFTPLGLLVGETHGRWIPEYKRFQTVFPTVEGTRAVTTIPGNHDIGLGDGITPSRLNRFKHHFTEHNTTSQILETCNFELILLDTPSILNTNNPEIFDPPSQF